MKNLCGLVVELKSMLRLRGLRTWRSLTNNHYVKILSGFGHTVDFNPSWVEIELDEPTVGQSSSSREEK